MFASTLKTSTSAKLEAERHAEDRRRRARLTHQTLKLKSNATHPLTHAKQTKQTTRPQQSQKCQLTCAQWRVSAAFNADMQTAWLSCVIVQARTKTSPRTTKFGPDRQDSEARNFRLPLSSGHSLPYTSKTSTRARRSARRSMEKECTNSLKDVQSCMVGPSRSPMQSTKKLTVRFVAPSISSVEKPN